ncbi:AI-2E family transporter [Phytomonospora endophytica]|uniref:Putative PurR-regulated permease PerM n=1 Tax=Phytomonospora endophytica TaxID=714109 RepID=A0A841FR61_9ACTN|nr:AI-2E family transporter [Phytomonospora endophytica]MBB6035767.1 putative PurR-regulated permease PerM [Phytomonospora endophytica]GIG69554.1 AI-2E family transporter [Phytomonospora endophytica]
MTTTKPTQTPLWRFALITGVVLLTAGVAYLAVQAIGVLVLIFLSFLLAAGLEPLVAWLTRRRVRRGLAVAIVCVSLVVAVAGLTVVGLLPAVRQFGELIDAVPEVLARLGDELSDENSPVGRYLREDQVQEGLKKGLSNLPSVLGTSFGVLFGVLGKIGTGLFSVLTVAALTVYFMLALPRIVDGAAALLGDRERASVMREALGKIGGYVSGQIVVCAAAGGFAYVFFLIAGVPYPALLALGVAALDLVPQVGATLGAILGVGMALTVGLSTALATIAFFAAYQLFENYLLAPRVFAKATSLTPLSAFAAALVGGAAAGLVGAIAALPVAAAGQVVVRYVFASRFEKK